MRENFYRAAFWLLMFAALLVFGGDLLAQTSPIVVSVQPKVVLVNPYKRTAFWFRYQIEPHINNRRYALVYGCGSELYSSQGDVNGEKHPKTTEIYVDLTVTTDCEFMACVVQVVAGKPKTICAYVHVRTPKEEP